MSIKEFLFPNLYKFLGRNSFSQAGEDSVLEFLWNSLGIKNPSYLELGVCDPRNGNNTYLYHLRGGKGVLVEADESQIELIKKSRPNDKVIHAGVSIEKEGGEADFYIFDVPAINTFDKSEAELREKEGRKILKISKVKLKTINELIQENFNSYPDYLSVDIEGLDFDVLSDLDYGRFPIPVICVETCSYSQNHIKLKDNRFEELLLVNGYFKYADTYINSIFVNFDWFHKKG